MEEGVAPSINVAERALRHVVFWRELSTGSAREAGGRFVKRMLSVVETRRRGGVATSLTAFFKANRGW